MSSRRGSKKRSTRKIRSRNRKVVAVVLGLGLAAYGAWSLLGGGNPDPVQAQPETPAAPAPDQTATAKPETPAAPKGPTLREVTEYMRKTRAEIHPLRGGQRYAAIRNAWEVTSKMLEGTMEPAVRTEVLPFFHEICDVIFFSDYRNEFSETYVIANGDSLEKIARSRGVTEDLLRVWNGIPKDSSMIRAGNTMKIVTGRPRAVVSKTEFTLSYYFGDRLARQYVIAHGAGNCTPVGTATVSSKIEHPDRMPGAGPMQLEMQDRWIGLTPFDENGVRRDGIGIHGTKYEDSIPGETSHGCVRMKNRDVIEMYSWVPYRMDIEIRA